MHLLKKIFFRNLKDRKRKKDIAKLSADIEKRVLEGSGLIDYEYAPEEIKPLIHSINHLINYFQERSTYEQDFSGNVSHELRTPLAGIRIQAETAISSNDLKIKNDGYKNILKAVNRSERLIEQLLVLSRLTRDRVDLKLRVFNLTKLAANNVGEFLETAKRKNVWLKMLSRKDLYIKANEGCISILLNNLISNAINYSPEGREIGVKILKKKDKIILSVVDNGVGISEDKLDLVIKRFGRVGSDINTGGGLGLSIVKRISDLHNADLRFEKSPAAGGLKVSIIFDEPKSSL